MLEGVGSHSGTTPLKPFLHNISGASRSTRNGKQRNIPITVILWAGNADVAHRNEVAQLHALPHPQGARTLKIYIIQLAVDN